MRNHGLSFSLVLLSSCDGCSDTCGSDDVLLMSYEYDHDDDGTVDLSETYTYDEDGALVRLEQRGDGHVVYTYEYDADGNLLTEVGDDGDDGTVDYSTTYAYDNDANVLTQVIDWDGDGSWEIKYTYTYDDSGNPVTEQMYSAELGETYYSATYRYDSHGNLVEACVAGNSNCWTWTYTYDDDGNMLSATDDYGQVTTYTYDEEGAMRTLTYVSGAYVSVYTYDPCEQLLTYETNNEGDWNGDGVMDYRASSQHDFTHDDQGNMLSDDYSNIETIDTDYDGIADVENRSSGRNTYSYTYE